MANLSTAIPNPNSPMVDPQTGYVTSQWWYLFQRLIARTGGTAGGGFMPTTGGTFTGPVAMGPNALSGSNLEFTGGKLDGAAVGGITPGSGAFTTLSASSTVSGAGFIAWAAAPPQIGVVTPNDGAFTTLSASGLVSGAGFVSLLAPYAPIASPGFTGTPTMPTAAPGTNTTQGATTAFVQAAVGGSGTVTSVGSGTGLTGGPITTTGTLSLAAIADHTVLANTSGGAAAPVSTTLTALIDNALGSVQGDILYRNGSSWTVLAPGSSGNVLQSGGIGANPSWTPAATGTVTNVATGTGLTGGPVTGTGTISLASIASLSVLSNITGGSAAPIPNTLTATIDAAIGAVQGDLLYRNGTVWTVLAPGTAGQYLITGGAAANPSWTSAGSFTTLAASSTVSGAGFTAWAASPPAIGGTAAAAGAFTTLSASSTITPAQVAGVVGTTTNNNAQAGSVGEVISSNIPLASAVALSTATAKTVTSISLTAGDWDVCGEVWVSIGTGGATLLQSSINTSTNAISTDSNVATARTQQAAAFTASVSEMLSLRPCRVSLSGTTTYFLVASVTFPSGTVTGYGNIIARRAR